MSHIISKILVAINKDRSIKVLKAASVIVAIYSTINVTYASGLLVEVRDYYHELPKSVSDVCNKNDNCPEIEISYVNTSPKWAGMVVNQNINKIIAGESVYPPVTFENVKVPASVKHTLDNFAKSQFEDRAADTSLAYSKMIKPNYIGHTGSLELFSIGGYDYWGGAHGMNFVLYSILDGDTKKEIRLDDMLLTDAKPVLAKLVEAKFDTWIIEQELKPNEYKDSWAFSLTDNVTFTDKGLTFLYQQYELAPYAVGMIELMVSYDDLEGVIKSKYIQDGKQLLK